MHDSVDLLCLAHASPCVHQLDLPDKQLVHETVTVMQTVLVDGCGCAGQVPPGKIPYVPTCGLSSQVDTRAAEAWLHPERSAQMNRTLCVRTSNVLSCQSSSRWDSKGLQILRGPSMLLILSAEFHHTLIYIIFHYPWHVLQLLLKQAYIPNSVSIQKRRQNKVLHPAYTTTPADVRTPQPH